MPDVELDSSRWLLLISGLLLLAVLAVAFVTGFVPYGSPGEVIKTFYSACNTGNYSLAAELLVPEANWALSHQIGAVEEGLSGICVAETKQGHLDRVEIVHQELRGDIARVRYVLYYTDGSTAEESQGLVIKHWAWKIAP